MAIPRPFSAGLRCPDEPVAVDDLPAAMQKSDHEWPVEDGGSVFWISGNSLFHEVLHFLFIESCRGRFFHIIQIISLNIPKLSKIYGMGPCAFPHARSQSTPGLSDGTGHQQPQIKALKMHENDCICGKPMFSESTL